MMSKEIIRSVIDRVLWTCGATKGNRELLANTIFEALAATPEMVSDDVPDDPIGCVGYLAGMAFGNYPSEEIGHCVSIIITAISTKEYS